MEPVTSIPSIPLYSPHINLPYKKSRIDQGQIIFCSVGPRKGLLRQLESFIFSSFLQSVLFHPNSSQYSYQISTHLNFFQFGDNLTADYCIKSILVGYDDYRLQFETLFPSLFLYTSITSTVDLFFLNSN